MQSALASKKAHIPRLKREYETRRQFGFSVEYLEADDLLARFSLSAPAALLAAGDAQVDAFRMTHRLIQRAAERGLRVYDRSEATRIQPSRKRVTLHTERGFAVTARRVLFATGYESQQYLKQKAGRLRSTFVLVSEPLDDPEPWPGRCLIWETARSYFYLRTTADKRVMAGGEDAPFATDHRRDRLLARKTRKLQRRFETMFPHLALEVDYAWAGTFGETKDGLAYIGRPPEFPSGYFALGYGGNGITYSLIAARILTDLHLGRPNPDADIFRFGR